MLATALYAPEMRRDTRIPFFEALLSEIHAEALSIVMVTSAASCLQKGDVGIDVENMIKEAPDTGPLIDLITCAMLDEAPTFDAPSCLADYIATLTRAQDCLAEFNRDVRNIGYPRAAAVHAFSMSESWGDACRVAESMVSSSFDAMPAEIHDDYRENVVVLLSLLRSAASGMRPCLNEEHKLAKPRLPQQRRWPRKPMLESCQLSVANSLCDAFIVDISAGGAGLAHVPTTGVGQSVALVLRSGRTLSGYITWVNQGQAGMQFSKPLHPADTLLNS